MIFHQPGNSRSNFNYNAYTYSKTNYAPHFHKNLELIYVCAGEALITVDGVSAVVKVGQMALVLPNQIHSFFVNFDSCIWVAVFSEEYVPHFISAVQGRKGSTFIIEPEESVMHLVAQQLIDRDCSLYMRKACFYAVCDVYLQTVSLEPRAEKSGFIVGELLDWVSLNYTQDITLKKAAQVFGYEYHYLSRLLNHGYGIRFVDLVNSYRIEHACELLRTTNYSMTRIIDESGFQSIRSFNMIFLKAVGCSPRAYRDAEMD